MNRMGHKTIKNSTSNILPTEPLELYGDIQSPPNSSGCLIESILLVVGILNATVDYVRVLL